MSKTMTLKSPFDPNIAAKIVMIVVLMMSYPFNTIISYGCLIRIVSHCQVFLA